LRGRADALNIDYKTSVMTTNGKVVREGDWLHARRQRRRRIHRRNAAGRAATAEILRHINEVVDETRRLGVRTNADTPQDSRKAREFGAEGIGLCRTEHMFFTDFEQPERSHERQRAIQEMILADTKEARVTALNKLLPFQRRDFIGISKLWTAFR